MTRDVASSLGADLTKMRVTVMEAGCIVVEVELDEGVCGPNTSALQAANDLKSQAAQHHSALRKGMWTCTTKAALVQVCRNTSLSARGALGTEAAIWRPSSVQSESSVRSYKFAPLDGSSTRGSITESIAPQSIRESVVIARDVHIEGLEEEGSVGGGSVSSAVMSGNGGGVSGLVQPSNYREEQLQLDNSRLRQEVQSLLRELDQVVADNQVLVEDNEQLVQQNAALQDASALSSVEQQARNTWSDTAPVIVSDKYQGSPTAAAQRDSGQSAGSMTDKDKSIEYEQLLADNMKLASDNRQLLHDNNRTR